MDTLYKLLGGAPRVKLLRLFMFNPEQVYERAEAAKRMKLTSAVVAREITALTRLGIVKKKSYIKEIEQGRGRNVVIKKKRMQGYALNDQFEWYEALRDFLLATTPVNKEELLRQLKPLAKLRLVIISGFFLYQWDRRLDLLIVSDKPSEKALANIINDLEIEMGRELRYAYLSTEDFRYRYSIQDRLIRDVVDYDHDVILDKMGMN